MVLLANAVTHPRAMVVHSQHALLAGRTMMSPNRPLAVAFKTVSYFFDVFYLFP